MHCKEPEIVIVTNFEKIFLIESNFSNVPHFDLRNQLLGGLNLFFQAQATYAIKHLRAEV